MEVIRWSVGAAVSLVSMHTLQVEQYGEEYQSQSWGPLINLVKESKLPGGSTGGAPLSMKDKATIKETLLTVNGHIQVQCDFWAVSCLRAPGILPK